MANDEQPPNERNRLVIAWVVLGAISILAVVFGFGPHMPPGRGSAQASDQTTTNILIAAIMAPITVGLLIYFVYALRNFRQRGATIVDGPPIRGHARIQATWIVATTLIVLLLAVFGSYSLIATANGAGGGQGSDPLAKPGHKPLVIQVIGQQWAWTFRYPSLGDFESLTLALPLDRTVELHVTSIDVIHSFWAYQLGVKADAVPGADNVAYVTAHKTGQFDIRCAEICGLWHGYMYTKGLVLDSAGFSAWVRSESAANAPSTRVLPPYAHLYYPEPQRRAG